MLGESRVVFHPAMEGAQQHSSSVGAASQAAFGQQFAAAPAPQLQPAFHGQSAAVQTFVAPSNGQPGYSGFASPVAFGSPQVQAFETQAAAHVALQSPSLTTTAVAVGGGASDKPPKLSNAKLAYLTFVDIFLPLFNISTDSAFITHLQASFDCYQTNTRLHSFGNFATWITFFKISVCVGAAMTAIDILRFLSIKRANKLSVKEALRSLFEKRDEARAAASCNSFRWQRFVTATGHNGVQFALTLLLTYITSLVSLLVVLKLLGAALSLALALGQETAKCCHGCFCGIHHLQNSPNEFKKRAGSGLCNSLCSLLCLALFLFFWGIFGIANYKSSGASYAHLSIVYTDNANHTFGPPIDGWALANWGPSFGNDNSDSSKREQGWSNATVTYTLFLQDLTILNYEYGLVATVVSYSPGYSVVCEIGACDAGINSGQTCNHESYFRVPFCATPPCETVLPACSGGSVSVTTLERALCD